MVLSDLARHFLLPGKLAAHKINDHARRHIAVFKPVNYLIDGRERLQFDVSLHLAVRRKSERFRHILSITDKRSPDGDTIRHHIEKRGGKFSRWQTDEHTRPVFAGHFHTLFKCAERWRRDHDSMSPATRFLLQGGNGIAIPGIDHHISPQMPGVGQFAVIDVNRTNTESHDFGVLDRVPDRQCRRWQSIVRVWRQFP